MTSDPRAFAVCMGMDAFRMALCLPTKNFTKDEVLRWLAVCAAA